MLNLWTGTGNVTTDIELAETPNGKAYCKFVLAVNRATGNVTDFIPCLAWDNQAKAIAKYCKKGSKMTVVGSLQTTSWTDKNSNKRSGFQIVVEKQDFLPTKGDDCEAQPKKTTVDDEIYGTTCPF